MANSKVRWNGTTEDGRTTSVVWGSNSFTWGDVAFIQDIVDGIGTGSRRERQDRLDKLDKDRKLRIFKAADIFIEEKTL